jgi:hypothetical protein
MSWAQILVIFVRHRTEYLALAQRHRRYGVGMIYLKLRLAGEIVNHKRIERLRRSQHRGNVTASG